LKHAREMTNAHKHFSSNPRREETNWEN
jgi:hypothetical protein